MKNIKDILADFGVDLGDKASDFEKAVVENYRTINDYNGKVARVSELETQLSEANDALKKAKETDPAKSAEVEEMRKTIADYQAKDEERRKADAAKAARDEFVGKFDAAVGDKKFASDFIRDTVFDKAFALSSKNPDMAVGSIIDSIVGNSEGVWANPQTSVKKMPSGEGTGGAAGSSATIQNLSDLKGMSVDEIRKHMAEVDKAIENSRE